MWELNEVCVLIMIVPRVIGETKASKSLESFSESWIAIEVFRGRARDQQIFRPVIASPGMSYAAEFAVASRLVKPE